MSKLITDYLSQGLASARPVTPANAAGTISYYWATDTGALSVYANGAWAPLNSGLFFFPPGTGSSITGSSSLFATKGHTLVATDNILVSELRALMSVTSGQAFTAAIYAVTTATGPVITSILGTATFTAASTAAQMVKFVFASPLQLVAGTRYVIAITLTSATSTTACPLCPATSPYTGLPLDFSVLANNQAFVTLASVLPAIGNAFSTPSGTPEAIGMRASF